MVENQEVLEDAEVDEDLSADPRLKLVLDHMNALQGKVEVKDLDFLLMRMKEMDGKLKELATVAKREGKILSRIKAIATSVLKDLDREKYDGPGGVISIRHITQVKNPVTAEKKEELWNWMREKGIYDRYAQVHAGALKSLFEAEMEIAQKEQGDDFDPVTFTLPGMEPATFFDDLKFTPSKK